MIGAPIRCCSCTTSTRKPREIAFSVGLEGSASRARQAPGRSLERGPQPRRQARQASAGHRGLWLPLVSCRRTGLSAAPHRDRPAAERVAGARPRSFETDRSAPKGMDAAVLARAAMLLSMRGAQGLKGSTEGDRISLFPAATWRIPEQFRSGPRTVPPACDSLNPGAFPRSTPPPRWSGRTGGQSSANAAGALLPDAVRGAQFSPAPPAAAASRNPR